MKGDLRRTEKHGVVIHSYTSPAQGWHVNTHIVEGHEKLLVFDAQLVGEYAEEVASYLHALNKPLDRIVISHAHPDHWAGLGILREHFPAVSIVALSDVARKMKEQGAAILAALRASMGRAIPIEAVEPRGIIDTGEQSIDGIRYDFHQVLNAESEVQLVAYLPDQRVLFAFDLVFPPGTHLFTVLPNFRSWMDALHALKSLGPCDVVFTGHGQATDLAAIADNVAYLRSAEWIYARSFDAAAYTQALKDAFPQRKNAAWADFSGRMLFRRA